MQFPLMLVYIIHVGDQVKEDGMGGYVARMGNMEMHTIFRLESLKGKPLGRPRRRWKIML